MEEVQRAIKKLKRNKAVGIDGLFNEVLKYGGDQLLKKIQELYETVFESEVSPLQWARGLIVPLFKGGTDEQKHDTGKYRGITLLSILGKTYINPQRKTN